MLLFVFTSILVAQASSSPTSETTLRDPPAIGAEYPDAKARSQARSGDGIVVFALNPADPKASELKALVESPQVAGEPRINVDVVFTALTGIDEPTAPAPSVLRTPYDLAIKLENDFDVEGADARRREIIRNYDRMVRIDERLITLAGNAAQDRAIAGHVEAENKTAEAQARKLAIQAYRRFPDVSPDKRHNPDILLWYAKAESGVTNLPTGTLTVASDTEGVVHADGRTLGPVQRGQVATFEVPVGDYHVWLAFDDSSSLTHQVSVRQTEEQTLNIDGQFEARLKLDPLPTLICTPQSDCDTDLQRLAALANANYAVGVHLNDAGEAEAQFVDLEGVTTSSAFEAKVDLWMNTPVPEPTTTGFSAWYLAPFGVGQLAQKRYVEAGIFAVGTAGIGIWNALALQNRRDTDANDPNLSASIDQQNLAATMFYGAIATSILESILVWAWSD